MRNRFKPNLTSAPRGSRRSSSQNVNSEQQSSSGETNQEAEKVSSKSDEENGCTAGSVIIEAAKTAAEDIIELESESSVTATSPSPSSSSSVSSARRSVRRSRIKPAVTPVARSRPVAASKGKRAQEVSTAGKDGTEIEPVSSTIDTATEDSSGEVRTKNGLHASSSTSSPSTVNTEESSEPISTEAQSKTSDVVGEVITSNDVETESSEPVSTPSLLRRKRVLPNVGSASRRRRSSVSKEPRDVDAAVREEGPVVVLETTAVEEEEEEQQQQQESVSHSSKRLRTVSEREKTADEGEPCVAVSENREEAGKEVEDESRPKGVKRRRGGRPYKMKEPSDPSQMTMQHLIYFNPKTNPMKSSFDSKNKNQARKRGRRGKSFSHLNSQERESRSQETTEDNLPAPSTPTRTAESQADGAGVEEARTEGGAIAPRVKLSADGSIILDEESLLIPTSPEKSLADSEIVYEDADEVNYVAYLKTRKVEKWTMDDTKTFYKALSQVGTDFSLMSPLFPTRQRKELKAKFKREEKLHRSLVEKALRLRNPIDVEMFAPRVEGEEIDDAVSTSEASNTITSTPEAGNATSVSSAPQPQSSPVQ